MIRPSSDSVRTPASQSGAARRLLDAAVECFARRGYFATTTREIARAAGLSPAALYVHYPSKEEMLYQICHEGYTAALQEAESAIGGATGPEEALRDFTATFVAWHARYQMLARVCQYEVAALTPEHSQSVRQQRRRYQDLVESVLRQGEQQGIFDVGDIPGTARAILSLCADVARWYSPHLGDPGSVGALYAELAVRMAAGCARQTPSSP